MLRIFTTFILFSIPLLVFPQTELKKLKKEKIEIQEQIAVFEDSLVTITKKIETMETKGIPSKTIMEPIKEAPAKVALEKSKNRAKKSFELRSAPYGLGEVIMKIEKGTPFQQIDVIGDYHLICISGNCGYVHKKFIKKTKAGNQQLAQQEEKKQQESSIPSSNLIGE